MNEITEAAQREHTSLGTNGARSTDSTLVTGLFNDRASVERAYDTATLRGYPRYSLCGALQMRNSVS